MANENDIVEPDNTEETELLKNPEGTSLPPDDIPVFTEEEAEEELTKEGE